MESCYQNVRSVPEYPKLSSLTGKKIYIRTFGCSHNVSDSEYMAGILVSSGCEIVNTMEECDAVIVNSCTVKGPSQESFINTVSKSKNSKKKVVLAGCVPQADRSIKGAIVGVSNTDKVVEVLEGVFRGEEIKFLSNVSLPSLLLPKLRRQKFIEIIPISQGCLGSCTYCKTKHARGKLISYPEEMIVKACKKAWESGAKELWITSEDTGVYGRDSGNTLSHLLISILAEIPKGVMIRLGMANPPYILEQVQSMIQILNHPNVYSFIHIPVQSGNNEVLGKMLREYTVQEFEFLCDKFLEGVPDITIATDIICGFPTETEENFKDTIKLMKKYKFPVVNISQFFPRPGTVAANWKKLDTKEVHKRSKETAEVFKYYKNYNHLLGSIQRIWLNESIEEEKNIKENLMVGHTKSYVKVLIKKDMSLLGKEILVKITQIFKWHVIGEIIDRNPESLYVNHKDYFKGIINNKRKLKEQNKNINTSIEDTFNLIERGTSNKPMDMKQENILPQDYYITISKKNEKKNYYYMLNIFSLIFFIIAIINKVKK